MAKTGRTYRGLARELDISHPYLVSITHGYKRCGLELGMKWAALSGLSLTVFASLQRRGDEPKAA